MQGINGRRGKTFVKQLIAGSYTDGPKPAQILLLQETRARTQLNYTLNSIFGRRDREVVYNSGTKNNAASQGAIIIIPPSVDGEILTVVKEEGEYVMVVLKQGENNHLIVSYYGEPETNDPRSKARILRLQDHMREISIRTEIHEITLGGDFNASNESTTQVNKPETLAAINDLVAEFGLVDAWETIQQELEYTWVCKSNPDRKARHDRIYTKPSQITPEARINLHKSLTDHKIIHLELTKPSRKRKGWRMNDALLSSPTYITGLYTTYRKVIENHIPLDEEEKADIELGELQHMVNTEDIHPLNLIRGIIQALTNFSEEFDKQRRRKAKYRLDEYRKQYWEALEEYEITHRDPTKSEEEINESKIKRNQARLDVMNEEDNRDKEQARCLGFRMVKNGDQPTKMFLGLSKAVRKSRMVKGIKDGSGLLKQNEEVAGVFAQHYSDLVSVEEEPNGTVTNFLGEYRQFLGKIPEDKANKIAAPFTEGELEQISKELKPISCPGPDGISNRLLQTLFTFMGKLITDMGNIFLSGTLIPDYLLERTVVFMLKEGKEADDCDNYRGLAMLPSIYKLFTGALARRLARAQTDFQEENQSGFTAGKGMQENSLVITETIGHALRHGKKCVVLDTDQRKAFDTANHKSLIDTIQMMNMPPNVTQFIQNIFREPKARITMNDEISEQVTIRRGCPQGDCISPILYNMISETLAARLNNDPSIPLYNLQPGNRIMPCRFADDTTTICEYDPEGIRRIIETLREWGDTTGIRLSNSKCKFMAINLSNEEIENIKTVTGFTHVDRIKHLGLIIREDGKAHKEDNLQPIYNKIEQERIRFTWRRSSPLGRAISIRTLLYSKYTHILQQVEINEEWTNRIWAQMRSMLWEGGRTQISQKRVNQPIQYGGLGLPKPEDAVRNLSFLWIRKSVHRKPSNWLKLTNILLEEVNRPCWNIHLDLGPEEWKITAESIGELSPFLAQTFKCLADTQTLLNGPREWTLTPILGSGLAAQNRNINSPLWTNREYRALYENGLKCVSQLYQTLPNQMVGNRILSRRELTEKYGPISPWNYITLQTLITEINRSRPKGNEFPADMAVMRYFANTYKKGCSLINQRALKRDRKTWSWGEVAKSYSTLRTEGLITQTTKQFTESYTAVKKSLTAPRDRWLSLAILNRINWNAYKQTKTEEEDGEPGDGKCQNCGQETERTRHLFAECSKAEILWTLLSRAVKEVNNKIGRNNNIPLIEGDERMFNLDIETTEVIKDTMVDVAVLARRVLFSIRGSTNPDEINPEMLKQKMAVKISTLITTRQDLGYESEVAKSLLEEIHAI